MKNQVYFVFSRTGREAIIFLNFKDRQDYKMQNKEYMVPAEDEKGKCLKQMKRRKKLKLKVITMMTELVLIIYHF